MTRLFISLVISAVLGAFGFSALHAYKLYTIERAALVQERGIQFSIAGSLWRYGVIAETNAATRAFVVRMESGNVMKDILVYTASSTTFIRQELTGADGLYTGLSAPTAAGFKDLTPGTRVALLLENRPRENVILARLIVLGNPL